MIMFIQMALTMLVTMDRPNTVGVTTFALAIVVVAMVRQIDIVFLRPRRPTDRIHHRFDQIEIDHSLLMIHFVKINHFS